jgi:membrane-associated phospholipid phosphatase
MIIKAKNLKAPALIFAFFLFTVIILFFFLHPGREEVKKSEKTVIAESYRREAIKTLPEKEGKKFFAKKNPDDSAVAEKDALTLPPPPQLKEEFPDSKTLEHTPQTKSSASELADLAESGFQKMPETPMREMKFYEPSQLSNIAAAGVNDCWALLNKPFNIDKKDSYLLLGSIGGTLALSQFDDLIHREVTKHPELYKNWVTSFGDFYGRPGATYIASASLTALGIALNKKEMAQAGLEVIESYFIANNINALLKRSFGRARPYVNKGNSYFTPFSSAPVGENSFPSGHSTLAFSLSTVLASHVDDPYLKALIFAPAVITAVSRVMQDVHWTSDVFMGSAVGYFVGTFISNSHLKLLPEKMLLVFDQNGNVGLLVKL